MKGRRTETLQTRLSSALKGMSRNMGGFPGLAKELAATVNTKTKAKMPKSKRLQTLASRASVRVSFSELEVLHAALSRHGYAGGLAGLLSPPRLMELLAARGNIVLVVGTKPCFLDSMSPITSTSHWDLRSVAKLTEGMYGQASRTVVSVQIDEIPLRSLDHSKSLARSDVPSVGPGELYPMLLEREEFKLISDSRSVICIGSPRANHAAEYVLAKMFDVEPFLAEEHASVLNLPFSFEWSASQLRELRSTFARKRLNNRNKFDEQDWRTSALWTSDQRHDIQRRGKWWTDYGVLAVQRRPSGGVWACCAGSGGPGTYAAACALVEMEEHLPASTSKRGGSSVLWAVVKAKVSCDPEVLGDNRRAFPQDMLVKPQLWPDVESGLAADINGFANV